MSTQIRGLAPPIRVMSRSDPPAACSGSCPSILRRARLGEEDVREDVREMARDRDEPVVGIGADRDGTCAERGHEAVHEPQALGRRRGRRRQEPRGALEQLRRRPLRAPGLRAADRVAPDETRDRFPQPRTPAASWSRRPSPCTLRAHGREPRGRPAGALRRGLRRRRGPQRRPPRRGSPQGPRRLARRRRRGPRGRGPSP